MPAARSLVRRVRRRFNLVKTKLAILGRYGALSRTPVQSARYLLMDREVDNFTYDIANKNELAGFLADFLALGSDAVLALIEELDGDMELRAELRRGLEGRRDRNRRMPFGRRLGWYAVVRARRPRLVVETGVHDGLGSTALLRALERNAEEGSPGALVSFDINRNCGWLIPSRLRTHHRIVIGDAVSGLTSTLDRPVDLFIHDSDHRYEYELAELETVAATAGAAETVYMSDNAHVTTALKDFAEAQGLQFGFWREKPAHHFYPGAGIGIAADRRAVTGGDRGPG